MEINLSQAVKLFYSQSSFEMIYLEAVANALDAGATKISIIFAAKSVTDTDSYRLLIRDNGIGFTKQRYDKFCKLLEVDRSDKAHKGLGRLVYLFYFDKVEVKSYFDTGKYRKFSFSENLGSKEDNAEDNDCTVSGSIIKMSDYNLKKLGDRKVADTSWIRKRILKEFYSRLYTLSKSKEITEIAIGTRINGVSHADKISTESLPSFEEKNFTSKYTLDGNMTLYYSIKECENKDSSIITALSIDNRNQSIEVYADENIPIGYEMVFILFSDSFQGQTDSSRQSVTFSTSDLMSLKKTFREQIMEILSDKLPKIVESAKKISNVLNETFPHLNGYFETDTIGVCSKADVIKKAQDTFFQAQRDILCKKDLTPEEFEKSKDLSGRALTEYVVFRQLTINNLKKINKKDLEAKIHNIILPQRTVMRSTNFSDDVYKNNTWILDDKFMTYSAILSEMEMSDLIKEITKDEVVRDEDRPDIAIIFSNDPKKSEKVDIVIVELKRKGLKPEENVRVEVQLEKRARKLYDIYGEKIQSLWLYGVAELDEDYKLHLATAGYHPLYSKGDLFVNTTDIVVKMTPKISIPAVRYVMDLDAVVNDADSRNQTFLNIIKSKFIK